MAKAFPLHTLIELAASRTEAAAQRLGELARRRREAEEKLAQLETYRSEYGRALETGLRTGIDGGRLLEYRRFLAQLDVAIEQQRAEVGRCLAAWESGRIEWLGERSRQSAYGTLAERRAAAERAVQARAEQRLHDELSRGGVPGEPREPGGG